MAKNSLTAIGIDLGGSHLTAALVNPNGQIKHKKTASYLKAPNGPHGTQLMVKLVRELLHHSSSEICGVGIACPGSVDFNKGIVLADSPNLIGWKGTRLRQDLESSVKLPVLIDNDANLAAWGEKYWGAGKKAENFICLTLGTGVGGGIIINNQIYRGSHYYAGEIGHMKINTFIEGSPKCSCGSYGCLEALISAPAIARDFARLKGIRLSHSITAKTVFDAAKRGDSAARQIVQQTAYYLGNAISSLINIFDPDIVIIGGGIAKAGPILFNPAQRIINNNSMPHPLRKPAIVPAKLGENAGLLGAAALVFSDLKK